MKILLDTHIFLWFILFKEIGVLYRQAVRLLRQVNADEERVILTFDRAGLVTYISDRRYFSIVLGIVPQLRYNYKLCCKFIVSKNKLECNGISLINFAMAISEQLIVLALGISAISLFAGILYQAVSQIIDRRRYPPQGKLFDIGGFRLHLNCVGQGTPTVVMDAGGGASSITWGLVPSEIAKFTRVCIYDRAGLGWSDPNLRIPRTSQQSVDELHALLTKADIEPPYILVGHSFGGGNMRLYASQYPEEVVGLVLVDSVHENQITPAMWHRMKREFWLYQLLRVASRIGVLRLLGEMNLLPMLKDIKQKIQKYPLTVQALFDIYKSNCYRPCYWATVSSERVNMKRSFEQLQAIESLGSLPLIVLSQGFKEPEMSDERFLKWASLQLDLTKLSSNSQQIIAENSGHLIPLDQPELVVSAVYQLINRA